MSATLQSTTRTRVRLTELDRAARMYRTNTDASRALGIHTDTFTKLCTQHGIETPAQRMKRIRARRF